MFETDEDKENFGIYIILYYIIYVCEHLKFILERKEIKHVQIVSCNIIFYSLYYIKVVKSAF